MNEVITETIFDCFKRANAAARDSEAYAVNTAMKWIEAGHALNDAKKLCNHGEWCDWLKEHWEYSVSWAQKLMKLSKDPALVEAEPAKLMDLVARHCGHNRNKDSSNGGNPKKELTPLLDSTHAKESSPTEKTNVDQDAVYEPPSEAHQPKEGEEYEDIDDESDDDEPPFDVDAEPVSPREAARSIADQFFQKLPTEQSLGYLSRAIDDYQKHNPEGKKCRLIHDELAIALQAILAARKAWRTWK